ncbi:MAG: ABC transporter permease [Enterococcus sp.]
MMIAMTVRNLKIYFSNKTNLFFSLLGSLIVFFLYLLFLRKTMLDRVTDLAQGAVLMDLWLVGGLLAVTGWTTSFSALGQLVKDKAENKFMDLSLSELSPFNLLLSYFMSSFLIAMSMQLIIGGLALSYFMSFETLPLVGSDFIQLCGGIVLTAFTATALNLVICSFVKSEITLRALTSMLGAVSGFLCTAYIPIGGFSELAVTVIKAFPLSYGASLFRRILVMPELTQLDNAQANALKEYLGIGYLWQEQLSTGRFDILYLSFSASLCLFVLFLMSKKLMQVTFA